MERVRPLPCHRSQVTCFVTQGMLGETLLFENGGLFEHFRGFRAGWLSNNKLYHSRSQQRRNTSGCSCLLYAEGINSCKWVLRSNYSSVFVGWVRKPFPNDWETCQLLTQEIKVSERIRVNPSLENKSEYTLLFQTNRRISVYVRGLQIIQQANSLI